MPKALQITKIIKFFEDFTNYITQKLHQLRDKETKQNNQLSNLAEREGFEPTVPSPALRFSRPTQSTTLPSLQKVANILNL